MLILLAKQAKAGNCRGNLTRLWSSEVAILAAADVLRAGYKRTLQAEATSIKRLVPMERSMQRSS